MYAKIHLSENKRQTYVTLVANNHEVIFTSEMYDDPRSSVYAIQLVKNSVDRILPDTSLTESVDLMRRVGKLIDPDPGEPNARG